MNITATSELFRAIEEKNPEVPHEYIIDQLSRANEEAEIIFCESNIASAFVWFDSPQGHWYWQQVNNGNMYELYLIDQKPERIKL